MKKINALVVDDSVEFTKSVQEYFKDNAKIKIVNIIGDGSKVLDYVKEHDEEIDLVLMDIILPGKDGVAILEELEKENLHKKIIVLSSYRKDYTIQMTSRFDVDFYMIKPCQLKDLEARICEIFEENTSNLSAKKKADYQIQLRITEMLHHLGVPSQIKGYQYLREGILMLYESTHFIGGITKEVYPEIALRYQTTPSRVERAIRHAIEISWNRADLKTMDKMFGNSIDYDRAKPTNSEFMVTLSDALRLENNRVQIYS